MKRRILAFGLLVLLVLFAAGWPLGMYLMPKQTAEAQPANQPSATNLKAEYNPTPPTIKGVDAELLKARWGDEFTPAAADVVPKVTKEQALRKALEEFPGTKETSSVEYVLGYLRNPGLLEDAQKGEKVNPQMADAGLVWILVFEGYRSISSGPPGVARHYSNELNVVISANTGDYIKAIIYR